MDKSVHKLRENLSEIEKTLKTPGLSSAERDKLEILRSQCAGALLNSWLPIGAVRKSVMFILVILGFYGVVKGFYWLSITWLFALACSPRIVGETLRIIGFLSGTKK
jgi:hypothetical protein